MAFCSKCGTQIEDGATLCPACAQQSTQPKADLGDKLSQLNNTANTTNEFDPADINQNKVMAILSYLSILVLVPLLAAPNSKFARFHANQGLLLLIVEVAWGIVSNILSAVLVLISPFLSFVVSLLGVVNILFAVLAILGIINAANGQAKELPVIGKYRLLK